ncbi:MAG: hypothetical protein HY721_00580 [Planctomycetes bacterium]|nr:hypothetical protein [Planctomycetota bacterium]
MDRDLKACQTPNLVADWRLNIAYNAALQLATAALAAAGFEAARSAHHHRVIQSLAFTLGADATTLAKFDMFRKKRNEADYERAGIISDTEADEVLAFALQLRKDVEAWIARSHPHLKP